MNEAIKTALAQVEQAHKPAGSVPWEADTPFPQPIYTYKVSTHSWEPSPSPTDPGPLIPAIPLPQALTGLAVFSWNVDFMVPHPRARMEAALSALQTLILSLPAAVAAVVFLQECLPADLETIGATGWVRAAFRRTDVGDAFWASGHYGTTTLVDRRLGVAGVFRAHYGQTRMERDALFVDVLFPPASEGEGEDEGGKERKERTVRLCNTHLESLASDPPFRPAQAAIAAKFMHDEAVDGAILAGDLNAIQPFDRTLHSAHGLEDAYLALGGAEDSEAGYTWGQQAAPELRALFGCSRMDKVWYCGRVAARRFERFGADVEVEDDGAREEIMRWGGFEKGWVTDHLGVFAEFSFED
ncbi:Endonuclease/exonuclease/phosphatase [Xylaria palmicola]|nr:Endonuclease/exonuclease/phosphatase [Xylaria palmicola]